MEKRVSFRNTRGLRLAGLLWLPEGTPPFPVVAFAHGLYSGKDSSRNQMIASRLLERGIGSLLLDFTGHGESDGAINEDTLIEDQADDLGAALSFLEEQAEVDAGRIGVSGSSSGAAMAIVRAGADPRIRCLVLRAPSVSGILTVARYVQAPTLVITGGEDVPILRDSRALMEMLAGEKRLEVVRGAGHLFEGLEQMEEATELTVDWFAKQLQ